MLLGSCRSNGWRPMTKTEKSKVKAGGNPAFDLEPARRLLGYEPEDSFPHGCHFSEEIRFASPEFAPSLLPDGELSETPAHGSS